jgi:SAM-dependent methyltransferase
MATGSISFDDGAAYERYMGTWSQLAGVKFLEWLAPKPGLRWLDVGCGNGAFTEMLVERCAPAMVHGVDPSEPQLAYARTRLAPAVTAFQRGDAMSLPFVDDAVDAAVMPLVIFFVPDPARGVAEMARVVAHGGIVSAYAWDMPGKGFPHQALLAELRDSGVEVPSPPSPDASRLDVLEDLWTGAGLRDVKTTVIDVRQGYASFDEYWDTVLGAPSVGRLLSSMAPEPLARFRARVRDRLLGEGTGRVGMSGRANAITGRV